MIDIDVVNKNIQELESLQKEMLTLIKKWKAKQSELTAKGYILETSSKRLMYVFPVEKITYSEQVSTVLSSSL